MFGNRTRNLAVEEVSKSDRDGRSDYRAETAGLHATITGAAGTTTVAIHNLSTRGLMGSAEVAPQEGESVIVRIDSLPPVHGQIRWVKGNRFGILLYSALPVSAFRLADQGRGRRPRPPRHVVRIAVAIEATGIDRSAIIQNVSSSGMALDTGLPVSPGKLLTVKIDGMQPLQGRVRWSRGSRCGLMLDEPLEQDVLERLIKK